MPLIEEAAELQELNPAITNTVSVLKPRKNNGMTNKNVQSNLQDSVRTPQYTDINIVLL